MKTRDAKKEFYVYSFTCQFLVWMQRPDSEELQGRPLSPSAKCRIEDLLYQRKVCLHLRTCIRRMCTCTSGLVIPQFRNVHNKIRWLLQRQINQTLKLTSFQQSMELLTRDQCTPLSKFPFSTEDRINNNLTKNPSNRYQAQEAQCWGNLDQVDVK